MLGRAGGGAASTLPVLSLDGVWPRDGQGSADGTGQTALGSVGPTADPLHGGQMARPTPMDIAGAPETRGGRGPRRGSLPWPRAAAMPEGARPASAPPSAGRQGRARAAGTWPDAMLLAVVAAALLIAALSLRVTVDDAFWQVAYGRLMLAHGRLPRRDPFSWTMARRPVLLTEWLFDLAMAAAGAAGPVGAFSLAAVGPLGLGLFALSLFTRLSRHRLRAGCLTLCLLLLVTPFETLLPQVASFVFLAAVWWLLERARVAGPRALLALPPLFALWANVHGTFYAGLALVALDAALAARRPAGEGAGWRRLGMGIGARWLRRADPRAAGGSGAGAGHRNASHRAWGRLHARYRRRTARWLPAALAASAAATLLNPYGWRLYPAEIALATSPFHLRHIAEFASPNFHAPYLEWLVLPAILGTLALTLATRRRLPARAALAALVLLGGALVAVRVMPYALFALGALCASALRGRRRPPGPAPAPLAALTLAAALVGVVRLTPATWPTSTGYPAGAAAYVLAHRAALRGHPFNTYAWGSYLLWRWRGHPGVYVDSRGDFYDQGPVLGRYLRVVELRVNPGPYLRGQGVGWALLPRATPLAGVLAREGWRAAYSGRDAVVLVAPRGGALPD